MRLNRIRAGLWLVLLLMATALIAGCGQMTRVAPETAAARYTEALKLEQSGQYEQALKDYQTAANGKFENQAQAQANLGRVAMALKKYDVAVQAYTALVQRHPDARVNVAPLGAPEDIQPVSEWAGTAGDHKEGGPLWQAEKAQDEVNRTKIPYRIMDVLVAATGRNPWISYALALFLFTAVVKLVLTPFTNQQFHSMRKMSVVQPKMKALQEELKDKPEELNRRMMQLYKDEGINPLGCAGGMVIQFPILIGLYSVIRMYNFQFRDGYFLWINPVTHALAPSLIAKNLAQPDIILLVLYAISMFVSQKLTMVPAQDEQQKQQQLMMAYMMPIMFLFILRQFPSAFILYWLMFNVLTTWQQWHLLKSYPAPVAAVPETPSPAAKTAGAKGSARPPAKRKKR